MVRLVVSRVESGGVVQMDEVGGWWGQKRSLAVGLLAWMYGVIYIA